VIYTYILKEDMGTSALRMIESIDGQLIRIGEGGQNFNPLMVFYDPERHGNSLQGMKRAYIRHKEAISSFVNIISVRLSVVQWRGSLKDSIGII
jgi:hypothetical protein